MPSLLRPAPLACGMLAAAVFLIAPGGALAQTASGQIFNQVFNVGGAGNSGPNNDGQGSVGCGGGGGGQLSDALNATVGSIGGRFDSNQPVSARRDLWRFCDNMTDTQFGAGSWTTFVVNQNVALGQNTGFAPAELFEQSDVMQSLGRWQSQNIGIRIQQLRLAMREGAIDPEVAIAKQQSRPEAGITLPGLIEEQRTGFFDLDARFDTAQRALMNDLQNISLSSTENLFDVEGLGYFANGRYYRLDADGTAQQLGSTTNGGGFTLGVDYRFDQNTFIGGAFGYSHFSTDFDFNLGNSTTNDYAFMAFGNHYFSGLPWVGDMLYVDGTIRGAYTSFDQTKIVPVVDGGPAFTPRTSDPSGGSFSVDAGVGLDWNRAAWRVNPYTRLRVTYTTIGAFTEVGGDGTLNLSIQDQSVTSVPLTLGTSVGYGISTGKGVVTPYVRFEYLHEFNDQLPALTGNLIALPGAVFTLPPGTIDRNYVQVGGGATMALAGGWSGFVDYDILLAYTALTTQTVTAGVRRDF